MDGLGGERNATLAFPNWRTLAFPIALLTPSRCCCSATSSAYVLPLDASLHVYSFRTAYQRQSRTRILLQGAHSPKPGKATGEQTESAQFGKGRLNGNSYQSHG